MNWFKYKHWTVFEAFSFFILISLAIIETINYFSEEWSTMNTMRTIVLCAVVYGYALMKTGSDQDIKEERKNG